MSTSYVPRKPIKFEDVVEWSKTPSHRTTREHSPFTREGTQSVFLKDEDGNILTVYRSGDNAVFKRWGQNDVEKIIARIEEKFETQIISEYEDDYWDLSNDKDYPDGNFYI